ncbi:hypothetical protein PCI56_13625 [Plesiomonas shigelloides subsp. oncorhynchi]|nr:hypothetical protein [Plesiomonas shigelloides]
MGLVIDIERWPVQAAVTMATEGVTANYGEVTSGGDGTADRKICKMLDKERYWLQWINCHPICPDGCWWPTLLQAIVRCSSAGVLPR